MTAPDMLAELEVATSLARQAGSVIMEYYQTEISVDYKGGDEPVTAADRTADEIIRAGLLRHFPGDGLLTEESADDATRLDKGRVWIVDPLDGTADFIEGTDTFAVQIALTVQGQPVLGVVYQPVQDVLFQARQGCGAIRLRGHAQTPLHVSDVSNLSHMCLVASRAHYSPFVRAAREALGIEEVQQAGSVGVKVGLLAQGACDLYLSTNVCKEWDLCAPHALLLEAGGRFTDLFGQDLVYNQPGVQSCHGLVASNGQIHAEILQALAPLRDQMEW